jgi:hypothetical protein
VFVCDDIENQLRTKIRKTKKQEAGQKTPKKILDGKVVRYHQTILYSGIKQYCI